mmetsp:Transcript_5601/g.11529  ORF Transcript_5601/g.11529 Transcript_5601/m.11529 type:complete len:469 (-) Transcript_5601:262-1668(-)
MVPSLSTSSRRTAMEKQKTKFGHISRFGKASIVICVFIVASILLPDSPDLVIIPDGDGGVDIVSGTGRFLTEKNEGVTTVDESVNVESDAETNADPDAVVSEAKSEATNEVESKHSTTASDDNNDESDDNTNEPDVELMEICGRKTAASIPNPKQCDSSIGKRVLLVEKWDKYGRTGNNLREFFHLFQYAKDEKFDTIAIVKEGWMTDAIMKFWYAIEESYEDWQKKFEEAFCVKIISDKKELKGRDIHKITGRDLFYFKSPEDKKTKIDNQKDLIKTLFQSYNEGNGVDALNRTVNDMCSAIDASLGEEKSTAVYSVIHSRKLEGQGHKLLEKTSEVTGCDPVAALNMDPDYVKSILEPIGMLDHPILLISDGENPDVFKRLHKDPDIGPQIREVPKESSWLGGDMTLAIMSNAFIGNPASSLSAFIAQSRVAFGLNNTYLFRSRDGGGEWKDVCDENCIFGPRLAL